MTNEVRDPGFKIALEFYESLKTLNLVERHPENGRERNTFLNIEHGFKISWPNGWAVGLEKSDYYLRQLNFGDGARMSFVLFPHSLYGGFRPVVTVVIEEGINMDLESYANEKLKNERVDVSEVIKSIGFDLGSALSSHNMRPFKGPSHERIFRFHKVVIKNDKAYIISAIQLPENALVKHRKLVLDLKYIVESFAFVVG